VGLAHVAVQRFEVEAELAQVFRLEPIHLQLDCHEAVQAPVEEQQVEREISSTHLHRKLGAYEAEVAAQLDEEGAQLAEQTVVQIGLGIVWRQAQEFQRVGILEIVGGHVTMHFSHRW
jgi:hypothetical protein